MYVAECLVTRNLYIVRRFKRSFIGTKLNDLLWVNKALVVQIGLKYIYFVISSDSAKPNVKPSATTSNPTVQPLAGAVQPLAGAVQPSISTSIPAKPARLCSKVFYNHSAVIKQGKGSNFFFPFQETSYTILIGFRSRNSLICNVSIETVLSWI